jgi:hypothetical protein
MVQVDWSAELYAKRIKRMDPSYFLLQVKHIPSYKSYIVFLQVLDAGKLEKKSAEIFLGDFREEFSGPYGRFSVGIFNFLCRGC